MTHKLGQYLDCHLIFPLLEFLQQKEIYPPDELLQAKLELLSHTKMVDYSMDIYKKLHDTEDVPPEMKKQRGVVIEQLHSHSENARAIIQILDDVELVENLKETNNFKLSYLTEQYGITPEALEHLYTFARFQFDCGNYSPASSALVSYRNLSPNTERCFSALWGKFAAEILMQQWNESTEDLKKLKEAIDNRQAFTTTIVQLQQRSWLLHWSLFVFFNTASGKNDLIDLFLDPKYLNAIQTNAVHLLRYLTVAVITNKKRKQSVLKDLIKVLQQEQSSFSDPITDAVLALHVNFDFDLAQIKLKECETVLANDFFLCSYKEDFQESMRNSLFETYCRIHNCIDISLLSEKLNMNQTDAEHWLVNLIRNSHLDAKIDSQSNQVIITTPHQTVHNQVIEKTKGLLFRSVVLATNLEKRAQPVAARYTEGGYGQESQAQGRYEDSSRDAF